jgi:hypothetical protein
MQMGDFHDDELCALASFRKKFAEARAELVEVGRARQRRGKSAEDIGLADDELREFDHGMFRAEERRRRELRFIAPSSGKGARK